MTLEQLRVLVAVAERQHMTRAAADLHLLQFAVSATIAALESEHGVWLSDRVERNIPMTAAGSCLLEEARALLGRAAHARLALVACREPRNADRHEERFS